MKEFDIIALGELNVDLILNRIGGFPEVGKEKFAEQMTLTLGSSTAIFAANAASLGSRVAFCGMIGNDPFGDLVEESLKAKHVDTRYLIRSDKHATGPGNHHEHIGLQPRRHVLYQLSRGAHIPGWIGDMFLT